MKNNGILLLILAYIAFFGIRVDVGDALAPSPLAACKPIAAPVITSPPNIPDMDTGSLENKDYVIRVLIKHIKNQNMYITTSNVQTSRIYNTYTECVVK